MLLRSPLVLVPGRNEKLNSDDSNMDSLYHLQLLPTQGILAAL